MLVDEKHFRTIANILIVAILMILSFIILKPILLSSIFGLILAFIFYPVYKILFKWVRSKNLAALIICTFFIIIIILPIWFFTPLVIRQGFEMYTSLQRVELAPALQEFFPSIFSSADFTQTVSVAFDTMVSRAASGILNSFTNLLLNFAVILLHVFIILFLFFFGLKEGDKYVEYAKELFPWTKETGEKIFKRFSDITYSVINGQVIGGIFQGLSAGVGLFIFGVPNALVLTIFSTILGVLPVIGPWLIWVPVSIFLFISGRPFAAIGLLIYGSVIVSWIDTIIRQIIVSKKTNINQAVILVSMIGGLLVFGFLGLILGPLIISYLILLIEIYKSKKI